MTTIYTAPNYEITAHGDAASLSCGSKTQTMLLRHGTDDIPAALAAALKKAGQTPSDYFCVAGRYVLRRAALPAWTAAVDARIAERHAEKALKDSLLAADIAVRGQRALVLHGSYLLNSSLVYVRPMDADEAAKFSPELRETAKLAMGDWTSIQSEVAQAFLNGQPRRNDGWLPGQESVVILLSEKEWTALLAGDLAALTARTAEKTEKAAVETARIEAARQQAETSGEPVELNRLMDECDGSVSDCSFDLVRRMIGANGVRFTLRTHCH